MIVVCLLPTRLFNQTDYLERAIMDEPYKGLLAYLVYLYLESLGVVRGDHCEIRESLFRHR